MSLISWFRTHNKQEILYEVKAVFILAAPALVAQFCRIAVYIVNGLFLVRLLHLTVMHWSYMQCSQLDIIRQNGAIRTVFPTAVSIPLRRSIGVSPLFYEVNL